MTGAEALAYLQRRLAEYGLAVEQGRTDELYDYLSEGRDELVKVFADTAPVVVQTRLSLAQDATDRSRWTFPSTAADPYRVLEVRDATSKEPLTPASALDFDGGHYAWDDLRTLRTAECYTPTGIEVLAVLAGLPITAATASTQAAWGIPVTAHRAAGKWAAVLALTADEGSDATQAQALLSRELDQLSNLYGSYDSASGLALREAFLRTMGEYFGDTLY